jgi:hypothetical protein
MLKSLRVKEINSDVIGYFKNKYPKKWILPSSEYGENIIFVKDLPKKYSGYLPDKIYHVSNIDNLDKIGIKTSSETESPFGYYDISFFYLDKNDAIEGSIPHIEGETFLYEIDTNIDINWLEGFNEPLDGEENITTSSFIKPEHIKKIKYD